MMIVLLLLGACFCVGLSYDEKEYGSTYRIKLPRRAQSIEFTPKYSSDVTILWKHDDPPATEDSRRKVISGNFVINNLTLEDSGKYVVRDTYHLPLYVKSIAVKGTRRSYVHRPGDSLNITFHLDPNSCNIYFFPESGRGSTETEIVLHGRLQYSYLSDCKGFRLLRPCGILNEHLEMPCGGRYEVRDAKDNRALVVTLKMEDTHRDTLKKPSFDTSKIGIGFGISFAVLSCCTCMKRCCCGKSSSKKDGSESPDAEPEYNNEPVGPRPEQVNPSPGRHWPAQPSYTPTGPLIHDPPTNVPPAYSEVSAPAEQADAPTFPVDSDPEPHFELKGMTFPSAPPLSSVSTYSDVYTSDKLNFL